MIVSCMVSADYYSIECVCIARIYAKFGCLLDRKRDDESWNA